MTGACLANALRTTHSTLKRLQVDRLVLKTMATAIAEGTGNFLGYRRPAVTLPKMKIYRGFPERLHHGVPHWVGPSALFHIRIALDRDKEQKLLVHVALAQAILDSAQFYQTKMRWHITLFLLMLDHVHAVLSFERDESMSEVIRDWKRFHKRANGVIWQEGYSDHRLRPDERGMQLSAKLNYIRQNPVVAGLCARAKD